MSSYDEIQRAVDKARIRDAGRINSFIVALTLAVHADEIEESAAAKGEQDHIDWLDACLADLREWFPVERLSHTPAREDVWASVAQHLKPKEAPA